MMAYTSARYDDSPMTAPTPIGRIIVAGPRRFFFAVRLKGSEDRLVVVVDSWSASLYVGIPVALADCLRFPSDQSREDHAYETVIQVTYSPTLGLRYAREGYPQRVK